MKDRDLRLKLFQSLLLGDLEPSVVEVILHDAVIEFPGGVTCKDKNVDRTDLTTLQLDDISCLDLTQCSLHVNLAVFFIFMGKYVVFL